MPEQERPLIGFGENRASPLVINLDQSPMILSPRAAKPIFDMDNDGIKDRISWITNPNHVFLALDRDNDGIIKTSGELFGNKTPSPIDGKYRLNGFLALRDYDENGDGIIDKNDPIYEKLLVWSDSNLNGVCDPSDLKPLSEVGVVSIRLDYEEVRIFDPHGNAILQQSTVLHSDGNTREIVDLWFNKEEVPGAFDKHIFRYETPEFDEKIIEAEAALWKLRQQRIFQRRAMYLSEQAEFATQSLNRLLST